MMGMRIGSALIVLFALSACGSEVPKAEADNQSHAEQLSPAENAAQQAKGGADDAPYYTKLPLKEFMGHVMQYAGGGVWRYQGYITDANGQRSLYPKNDAEWEDAESGALLLAETTNVLLIPGRRVPDPRWDKAVEAVRDIALQAADAAEKHDKDRFTELGGQLDKACDICHVQFDPTFQQYGK